ncbi:MAG: hypothetical protein HY782_06480 [Chloroflexi bacterium]|nr:hypothetical protein [Chloroflexota bacterium]
MFATLQYTSWEELPVDYQAFFIELMDNQPQRGRVLFALYYYWFNIAHECGHILRKAYGTRAESRWVEEQAATEFAVAYWRAFGEEGRLAQLADCVEDGKRLLPNPILPDEEPAAYYDTHYTELTQTPHEHSYLQFAWVLDGLAKKQDLTAALRHLVTEQAHAGPPMTPRFYLDIDVHLPLTIIPDLRQVLAGHDVILPPVEIVQSFSPAIQFVGFGS